MKKVPEEINKVVDFFLAFRPRPKTRAAKKRQRKKMVLEKKEKPAQ